MTDNTIDELMDKDPLELTPSDIDQIIEVHRRNRANWEAGVKPKKEAGPSPKIDLGMLGIKKEAEPVKRRC